MIGTDQLDEHVIDVRQANEYCNGHIPDARNIELGAVPEAPLESSGLVTVMCGHGERAMTAASLLAIRGIPARVLDGGPGTWATITSRMLEIGS